ncbi:MULTISPECIES: 5'/3'-nucleotidase SurE [unclassified Streptomyces]|uniref:5'/3'-nucleotidase SurE n=1 Tax=unclassified Streptomyces TaxID=2593676 RepID=UPI0034106BA4
MKPSQKILACAAGLAAAITLFAATVDTASGNEPAASKSAGCPGSLDILLTNDDGYAAPGINALYDALRKAGHHVTMVAPLTNQTGKGGSIAYSGTLGVTHPVPGDNDIWAVDGTPADAVAFGIATVFADRAPDLVVSGTNSGTNLSLTTNHSGTLGAATTALDRGVPTIAVSTAHPAEFDRDWDGAGGPDFAGTASLTERIVGTVQRTATDCDHLMPRHEGLNVNYPSVRYRGVREAEFGDIDTIPTTYTQDGEGKYTVGYDLSPLQDAAEGTSGRTTVDYELVARGYASITPLDGSLSATKDSGFVGSLVRDLG